MKKLLSSLRVRLVLFVLFAALPALAVTLYTGLEQRRQAAAKAQDEALRIVRFAAVNHELLIENTRGYLIALSHSLATQDLLLENCRNIFSHLLDVHFPYYSAFYVADLNGNILCTMPHGDVPEDLPGCEHYQELVASDDFVVSEYHLCRNSGKGVIAMGYPVRDTEDHRVGVINVSIDLAWFNQVASDANLPAGSTLTVMDRKGVILAHYPDPEKWVGKTMPEGSIADVILTQGEGTAEGLGTDGEKRLFAFVPLGGTEEGVHISVGIPSRVAFAEVEQTTTRNLILLGVVTFLALAAAWILVDVFIMRQTRGLIATTDKLASGDLTARTNLSYEAGEVGQLARAFDRMADSLAERNRERDRAERSMQEYAAELERSNRDLQDFANIASHDMQEPLRKIQVFSDLMQMRYGEDLDERGVEYLERMQSAAHRMQELINDLLAYSRISTRAKPFEPVDLNHIIQEVLTDFDLQIEKGGAVVKAEELPKIEADPIQMHQLFQNLISNALKFHKTGQAPVVKISGEKITGLEAGKDGGQHEARRYQIRVSDEGIGFEEKYRERIFLPFQRLYGPGDYEGSGMGLAICRKIVQRHGGVITVSSKPGEGTTFYIDLPINQDGERKMP